MISVRRRHPRTLGRHARRRRRRLRWALPSLVALAAVGAGVVAVVAEPEPRRRTPPDAEDRPSSPASSEPPYGEHVRAFKADSWWNAPLPDDPPLHPSGVEILRYIRNAPESGKGCLVLAGAGRSPWGQPIYWARPSDPEYDVTGIGEGRPPELKRLRIPHAAEPAANSDGSMTIYDKGRGYVVALTNAEYDEDSDTWTAAGGTVTYLGSNGLHVDTGRSDDPRNRGTHRGNNGAVMAVSWDQVQEGAVRHVLKVALGPEVANRYVFPMVGSDGDYEGDNPRVPPQGLRLRIRPSVDLDELELHPEAEVIARALQRYGIYIGDSGGATALKLENTRAEGRGQVWNVPADGLCGLPFTPDYWDVLAEGYDPSS